MAERNNDKGLITWIAAIVNLVFGIITALVLLGAIFGVVFGSENLDVIDWIFQVILAIIWACVAWYWIKRTILIILGKAANSWPYAILSFFMGGLIGGIAMTIAKILN